MPEDADYKTRNALAERMLSAAQGLPSLALRSRARGMALELLQSASGGLTQLTDRQLTQIIRRLARPASPASSLLDAFDETLALRKQSIVNRRKTMIKKLREGSRKAREAALQADREQADLLLSLQKKEEVKVRELAAQAAEHKENSASFKFYQAQALAIEAGMKLRQSQLSILQARILLADQELAQKALRIKPKFAIKPAKVLEASKETARQFARTKKQMDLAVEGVLASAQQMTELDGLEDYDQEHSLFAASLEENQRSLLQLPVQKQKTKQAEALVPPQTQQTISSDL